MTSELVAIPVRNELVSGLMACAQGLDVTRVGLTTSASDLQALLYESVVLNLKGTVFKHENMERAWLYVTWNDDADMVWEITVWLTPDTFIEFVQANDAGRWGGGEKSMSTRLTHAELTLTIEKEITRNGA